METKDPEGRERRKRKDQERYGGGTKARLEEAKFYRRKKGGIELI